MLLKILQILLFWNYGVHNIFSFGFIEPLDLKGILKIELRQPWNALTRQFHFYYATNESNGAIIQFVDQVMWCLQ